MPPDAGLPRRDEFSWTVVIHTRTRFLGNRVLRVFRDKRLPLNVKGPLFFSDLLPCHTRVKRWTAVCTSLPSRDIQLRGMWRSLISSVFTARVTKARTRYFTAHSNEKHRFWSYLVTQAVATQKCRLQVHQRTSGFIDHSGINLLVAATLFCEFADFIIFTTFPNVRSFYRPKYSVTDGFLIVMWRRGIFLEAGMK